MINAFNSVSIVITNQTRQANSSVAAMDRNGCRIALKTTYRPAGRCYTVQQPNLWLRRPPASAAVVREFTRPMPLQSPARSRPELAVPCLCLVACPKMMNEGVLTIIGLTHHSILE